MEIIVKIFKNEKASYAKLLEGLSNRFNEEPITKNFFLSNEGFKAEAQTTEDGCRQLELVVPEWVTIEIVKALLKHPDALASTANEMKSKLESMKACREQ